MDYMDGSAEEFNYLLNLASDIAQFQSIVTELTSHKHVITQLPTLTDLGVSVLLPPDIIPPANTTGIFRWHFT